MPNQDEHGANSGHSSRGKGARSVIGNEMRGASARNAAPKRGQASKRGASARNAAPKRGQASKRGASARNAAAKRSEARGARRGWGGRRAGAGRKPTGERAGVRHARRPFTDRRRVVFVTLRVRDDVPNLRKKKSYRVVVAAFSAWREREGFRLLHYSVMGNHLHLVAEAKSRRVLSRAMQGIAIRIAKGLNRAGRAHGRVFSGRYHNAVLTTERAVRNVLAYVLCNARKHRLVRNVKRTWVDPWSSASAFDGWLGKFASEEIEPPPIARPESKIGRGWHRSGGGIPPDTVPGKRSDLAALVGCWSAAEPRGRASRA